MTKHIVHFEHERETKNTVRYSELPEMETPIVGKLYVNKKAVELLGRPKLLKVTIEADR